MELVESRDKIVVKVSLKAFLRQQERYLLNTSKSVCRIFKWIPSCDLDEVPILVPLRLTLHKVQGNFGNLATKGKMGDGGGDAHLMDKFTPDRKIQPK